MISLTPQHLAAAYDCLRAFKPFASWKLPPSEVVKFQVLKNQNFYGFYIFNPEDGSHTIQVSDSTVGHLTTLMAMVAHEMIHMRQQIAKTTSRKAMHNAQFKKIAALVCREHGFDPKWFV